MEQVSNQKEAGKNKSSIPKYKEKSFINTPTKLDIATSEENAAENEKDQSLKNLIWDDSTKKHTPVVSLIKTITVQFSLHCINHPIINWFFFVSIWCL